ncbi:hypothetical protein NM208_g16994 [Fusarium decemcellulare]|uniref:Uncharacterized protein n=1 Tax=Fusarium decemcellulare TaxID=57161 RepID=A0ACC1RC07_9HYPO|nr:hypothetical protein NM208_g16994 [Fusarium decemcellulare]
MSPTSTFVPKSPIADIAPDPAAVTKAQGSIVLPQNGDSARPRFHGNGLASLFQDEQVLSGEGRLEPGRYEFGFNLMFPEKDLPSSIDFERGTVSYMVTATLTRPTSITPTSSCERKVMLVENVDIGLLQAPRPRTIFLEPISKRTRRKKSMMLDKSTVAPSEVNEISSEPDPAETPTEETRDHAADSRSPQSDIRSEVSGESGVSGSTSMSRPDLTLSQVGTLTSAKQQAVDKKTITATIELLKGGCLPGDAVSVRVTVQHIKRVKSMTGVIVTLYRQGKIDSNPSPALFNESLSREDLARMDKDEVFPRSRTGLGGLTLSSSSSTSMFRKDLDQNIAPLIIDPSTMQTSVTVPVKLPDDSFPTIKGVPGEMISFKYLVEVVVDLGGRLASQMQTGPASRFGSFGHATSDNYTYGPRRGANIADTSQLRHEKGVISVSMETVVGTVDTSRGRKRSRPSPPSREIRIPESDEEEALGQDMSYANEVPSEPYRVNGQLSPGGYFSPQSNGTRHPPPPIPSHPPQPYSQVVTLQPPSQLPPPSRLDYSRQQLNGFAHPPAAPMQRQDYYQVNLPGPARQLATMTRIFMTQKTHLGLLTLMPVSLQALPVPPVLLMLALPLPQRTTLRQQPHRPPILWRTSKNSSVGG